MGLEGFSSIQSIPEVKDEISSRVYGAEGTIYGDYFTEVGIRAKDLMREPVDNLYTAGTQVNISEFHKFITDGQYENPTVAPSVRSNLTAIMGREAAYRSGQITWKEMLAQAKKLEPNLKGLKS